MFQRLGALLLVGSVVATLLLPTMTTAFSSCSPLLRTPTTLRPVRRDSLLPTTPQQQRNLWTTTPRYYRHRHADDDHHTETHTTAASSSSTSSSNPDREPAPPELQSQTQSSGQGAMNLQMIQNLCASQGVILVLTTAVAAVSLHYTPHADWSTVWNWSPLVSTSISASSYATAASSSAVLSNMIAHLWQGVAAAFPLIGLETYMKHQSQVWSDRSANRVHFATTNMVVTLFGRRRTSLAAAAAAAASKLPNKDGNDNEHVASTGTGTGTEQATATTFQVTAWSVLVTTLTAVSEEIVFRGYLSAAVMALTGSWAAAWLGPAALFGAGHAHAGSTFGENKIVTGFQTVNGLWYGLVYMCTGSLVPGIMAHLLYDTHVLVAAWHDVNEQMDWTEAAYPTALSVGEQADITKIQTMSGDALTTETLNFCRRFFYAFDHDHVKSLSLVNVQQAVSYAFLQDKVAPSTDQVQDMFAMVLDERNDPRRHDDDDPAADAVTAQDDLPADRLRLTEFLRLLFALRAQTYQKASAGAQSA
jgi:membrane protease YdiL (CAAX protease family)